MTVGRPTDATLSVAKAARVLGVHPNTIRAWSDQNRLRYYRINARGDRRYRLSDLQRFLAAAESGTPPERRGRGSGQIGLVGPIRSLGPENVELRTRPTDHRPLVPRTVIRQLRRSDGRPFPGSAGAGGHLAGDPTVHAAGFPAGNGHARAEVAILARLADLVSGDPDVDSVMVAAVDLLHDRAGHDLVAILERRDGRLHRRFARGVGADQLLPIPESSGLPARALASDGVAFETSAPAPDWLGPGRFLNGRIAAAIPGPTDRPWGVLLVADEGTGGIQDRTPFVGGAARALGVAVRTGALRRDWSLELQRSSALSRIATDVASRLDLDEILAAAVDNATDLFGAQRAAIFLRRPDGGITAEVSRGLSAEYLAGVREVPVPSLPADAVAARRPMYSTHYRDDPRAAAFRDSVVAEGFDTICTAPLLRGTSALGLLNVYHDRPRLWTPDELETLGALASLAAAAIWNAQSFAQMATWAAHLQSIQQLGVRLSHFTDEHEIGQAIANELETLIDFHNVRVYRLQDDGWLVPTAMRGLVGEFKDETPDMLRIRVGQGITGWVAREKVAQILPDASSDPRAETIQGTDDIPESMLVAPMLYEEKVLGVLVLSKLGLRQFTEDDLRLLVIYASLAAQAIVNVEATERVRAQSARLQRRVDSQRAIFAITEAIVGIFDIQQLLGEVADRLEELVPYDNFGVSLDDGTGEALLPLMARGVHADAFMRPWEPGEEGIELWVIRHGEPQLIPDELSDPRIYRDPLVGPVEGSLAVVPLRGPDGVLGVLTLERLGRDDPLDEEDFELVQLFAAQVAVALRNAELYRAKEIEAQTDQVTGLLNAGTLRRWLDQSAGPSERFGLIMLDLDRFKDVNETMGHEAGTELLVQLGAAVAVAANRESDRVFRYGGDEIVVILPSTEPAGTVAVAQRIRESIRDVARSWAGSDRVTVSASLGVANFPKDGSTKGAVLLAADRACFVAKRGGRGSIATAAEGLAVASEITSLSEPTPVDPADSAPDRPLFDGVPGAG